MLRNKHYRKQLFDISGGVAQLYKIQVSAVKMTIAK